MNYLYKAVRYISVLMWLLALPLFGNAQNLLNKVISLDVKKKPVSAVLKNIGAQGGFYFSYNSNLIVADTAVTLSIKSKTVKEVLDMLFAGTLEYNETGNYIVLRKATGYWYASGYIVDENTGERIPNASVYEKQQFVSTLTNEHGYFRLKLKNKLTAVTLFVSRHLYFDTAVTIRSNNSQEISIRIAPKPVELDSIIVRSSAGVEKSWFSKLFLSSRQRIQSVNLGKYFVDKPYQASFIPGLSSHGRMSTQVVNKVSFNLIGGYTAGVNGVEIGGVFNVVKNDVKYAQVAGVANIAGGYVNGIQFAGVYNQVLEASKGWQFAGASNFVNDSLSGVQVSGVYNHISGDLKGLQVSGAANFTKDKAEGVQVTGVVNYSGGVDGVQISGVANVVMDSADGCQITGVANFVGGEVDGTQISCVLNYAKHLKGAQIGLINIADTSEGVSVGLLNFVFKGYHKLSVFNNEVMTLNAAIKSGNSNLYSIMFAGMHTGSIQKAFSFGYGFGSELKLSKHLTLNPELSAQHIYLGNWDYANMLYKLQLNLNYKINKYIAVYAGPSYNAFYSTQSNFTEGYTKDIRSDAFKVISHDTNLSSWIGWTAGISFF